WRITDNLVLQTLDLKGKKAYRLGSRQSESPIEGGGIVGCPLDKKTAGRKHSIVVDMLGLVVWVVLSKLLSMRTLKA
ncbi:hypothetical protein SB724_19955, partial [Bacillus sp. SIMBA_031]|uniref:hypothetical protein n=1 Tax=Bacillus sp. SIMBA_031 TaxID=3085774 RepID=UPI00397A507E